MHHLTFTQTLFALSPRLALSNYSLGLDLAFFKTPWPWP